MPNSDRHPNGEKPTNDKSTLEAPQDGNRKDKRPHVIIADEDIEAFMSTTSSLREDNAARSAKRVKLLADITELLDNPIGQYSSTAMLSTVEGKDGTSNKFDRNPRKRARKSNEEDNDNPSVKRTKYNSTDTRRTAMPIRTRPSASTPIPRHRDNRPLEQQLASLRIVSETVSASEEDSASALEASPDDKLQDIKVEEDEIAAESHTEPDNAFYHQMQEISLIYQAQGNTITESSQADREETEIVIKQEEAESGINMEDIPEAPEFVNPPLPLSWGTGVSATAGFSREELVRGLDLSFLHTDRPDRYS